MSLEFDIDNIDVQGGRYTVNGVVYDDPTSAAAAKQELQDHSGLGSGIGGLQGAVMRNNDATAAAGYRNSGGGAGAYNRIASAQAQFAENFYAPAYDAYQQLYTPLYNNDLSAGNIDYLNFGSDYWQHEAEGGLDSPGAVSDLTVTDDGGVVNGAGATVTSTHIVAAEHDAEVCLAPPTNGNFSDDFYADLDADYDQAAAQLNTVRDAYENGTLNIENVPPAIRSEIHDAYVKQQVESGAMTRQEASEAFATTIEEDGLSAIDANVVNEGLNRYEDTNIDGMRAQKEGMQNAPIDPSDPSSLLPPSPNDTVASNSAAGVPLDASDPTSLLPPQANNDGGWGNTNDGVTVTGADQTAPMTSDFANAAIGSTPVPGIAPESEIVVDAPAVTTEQTAEAGTAPAPEEQTYAAATPPPQATGYGGGYVM